METSWDVRGKHDPNPPGAGSVLSITARQHQDLTVSHVTYVWRGLAPTLALRLPVGLVVSVATGVSLDEGDVVVVGAGRSGQDPHEVAVVAEILEEARHPPEWTQKHPRRSRSRRRDERQEAASNTRLT